MSQAEASLAQCLETTERTGERWSEAELHRYRGMLLEQSGKPLALAQACYRQAIAVAQRQGAVAWELRATMNLASSLIAQDAKDQARKLIESLLKRVSLDLTQESDAQIESLLAACGEAKGSSCPRFHPRLFNRSFQGILRIAASPALAYKPSNQRCRCRLP